jgi:hypothetical protein
VAHHDASRKLGFDVRKIKPDPPPHPSAAAGGRGIKPPRGRVVEIRRRGVNGGAAAHDRLHALEFLKTHIDAVATKLGERGFKALAQHQGANAGQVVSSRVEQREIWTGRVRVHATLDHAQEVDFPIAQARLHNVECLSHRHAQAYESRKSGEEASERHELSGPVIGVHGTSCSTRSVARSRPVEAASIARSYWRASVQSAPVSARMKPARLRSDSRTMSRALA